MKLIVLAVFCFCVQANNAQNTTFTGFRPGMASLCKKFPVEVGECCLEIVDRDEACTKIGNCLVDNEGAVNDKKNFVYPCVNNDIECVRKVLGEKCMCSPVSGPVKDPYCTKQYRSFYPSANVSVILVNEQVWGLEDASVEKFFINKKTGYLILTIKFPVLTITTPKVCYEYHRLGKESIIKCDRGTVTYRPFMLTYEFPAVPECRMDLGRIHGYVGGDTIYSIGPNIYKTNDPSVKLSYNALKTKVSTAIKEVILLQAEVIGGYYMQNNICNFDVKLCAV